MTAARLSPRGLAAATAAFTIWGLFPVYLHPLSGVPAIQVIAHRVTWSCLFLLAWMLARGELGRLTVTLTRPALLARLMLTSLLISCNWLVYVWSVTHAHIVDTSLGYYINPLMNVVLGVLVLRERLNRAQWTAVALAAIAVLYLAVLAGRPPWIAGTLAVMLFPLRAAAQDDQRRRAAGTCDRDAVAHAARARLSHLVSARRQRGTDARGPGRRGAADRQRAGHGDSAVSVRLRRARAAVLDRRRAAVHRAEPAARCAACCSSTRASARRWPPASRSSGWRC